MQVKKFIAPLAAFMIAVQSLVVTSAPALAQLPPSWPSPVKLTAITITKVIEDKHIEVEAKYPQVVSPTAKLVNFNAAALKSADDIVTHFISETEPPPADLSEVTSTLQISYKVLYNRKGLLSVLSNVGYYAAGAAHPSSYSTVINYDVAEGKGLDLVDLFKPDTQYLDLLSTYCKATLKRRARLEFPEGADPKPENYDSWNITTRGLQINFDDYQVTSHATGPQQCVVPIATLSKVLKDPARLR